MHYHIVRLVKKNKLNIELISSLLILVNEFMKKLFVKLFKKYQYNTKLEI